ncbi:PilT/PilU family type 4a pilus ATPase [Glaciimonas immobilis]|uniref:Twitching motility protein PilU n=1 Tax=Glaciimonas immobilis TaxID=728004 RepID=A0A840RNI4_9BURK|nr:PilT/PilU family type 4a pilus ATPase [Glaciimonas immobilis]KAF3999119.1 PilT/PilU family type 4a pilus ATPase [Glaciimonas immobilis]MBB5198556.1 twitching motility protein PilU [Glaciimonas immobilis]
MAMDRLFRLMQEKEASDMFLTINSVIHLKIKGQLLPINQQKMDKATILLLLNEVVPIARMQELERDSELNMGLPVTGVGSFRLSVFKQRGNISAVIRYIPFDIPAFNTLGLPPILTELINRKRGLLLVVGACGSGKSTTIASLLDYRNKTQAGHILTLEDPIEFLFKNERSIINQRELGIDTDNLGVALKNALRQAPDCILIGEIRDKETMSAALAYAQSGHLVVSTLHANNSYRALNRVISFFPPESRTTLLEDLSSTLTAIVSQRLVNTIDDKRAPAVEIMLNTRHISELMEEGKISLIKDAMERSMAPGSQTFEQALMQLIEEGIISEDEALSQADSPTNLYWLISNSAPVVNRASAAPVPEKSQSATYTEFTLDL